MVITHKLAEILSYLCDNRIQNFSLERPENDGLVLDRINDKSLSRLNEPGPDVVDGGDGDDEAVFSGARALHLRKQLLFDGFDQLRTKISRVQKNFVVQRNVVKHPRIFVIKFKPKLRNGNKIRLALKNNQI